MFVKNVLFKGLPLRGPFLEIFCRFNCSRKYLLKTTGRTLERRVPYSSERKNSRKMRKGGYEENGNKEKDVWGEGDNTSGKGDSPEERSAPSDTFKNVMNSCTEENLIPNLTLAILKGKWSEETKKRYIDEYKECINEHVQKYCAPISNISKRKKKLQYVDIFSTLYLCYMEKVYDQNMLTKLSEAFDMLYTSHREGDILKSSNITYLMMFFYYFSILNVKNVSLYNSIKSFIMNNQVEPLLIYKYLECLSLIKDTDDNVNNDTHLRDHIIPIIEILTEEFYTFNNYLLLNILHFLHSINFIDRDFFSLLTKKLNKNVYLENANRYELCMLTRMYAMYKKENITFNKYVCEDLVRSIARYEDNFQIEGGAHMEHAYQTRKSSMHINDSNYGKEIVLPERGQKHACSSEESNQPTASYIDEIKNINRDNYTFFKNKLYCDGLNFYAFFANSKTTNKNCFQDAQRMNIHLENIERSEDVKFNSSTSEWKKLFCDDEYRMREIKNENFVNCQDNHGHDQQSEERIIIAYNNFLKENLFYQFSYEKCAEVMTRLGEHLDGVTIDINKGTNIVTDSDDYAIVHYKKRLLFIDNYYIGHIFHIADSLLSLKVHHNCTYFNVLQNKILNVIKNNEHYILNNFDSTEIKNLLIFLSHTNKYYKESFIYSLTHRIIDLYINNLCKPNILATYLHHLLNFTKQKVTKKNRFNHTIRNIIYSSYPWLNYKKHIYSEKGSIDNMEKKKEIVDLYNNIKVENYTLLQVLSIYMCKNVYFMSLTTLASLLRSLAYLSFNDINFYNVFIPLFMKHINSLKNVDILNITQAYNKQKIKNKYFYYLLSKQYQNNSANREENSDRKVKLIG
ncbi:conserved Plasmodium protein, unknown function [Plasmodium ovale]|uniref:Uncharacterized protein n=1 Tax=Plasmodium ovale TaxID=36330 RepID=A0A1D3TMA7_PLAOA|nr:conserved Plasmodium protein, unknown function [Plasmodium ovale]